MRERERENYFENKTFNLNTKFIAINIFLKKIQKISIELLLLLILYLV